MKNEIIEVLKTSTEEYGFDLSGFNNICKFCKWNDNNGNCKENKDMGSIPNFGTDEAINYICESFDI